MTSDTVCGASMKTISEFASSYQQARVQFRAAADAAGWGINTYTHPTAVCANGGRLSTDVAVAGPLDASANLLVVSGTHGIEGYAGSAAQIAFIKDAPRQLPTGVRVVMVHAINPWGFEFRSRTNENNVDINRNFLDWDASASPENPEYAEIHALLGLEARDAATNPSIARLDPWIEAHGISRYYDAISRGQYQYPRGLMYGGSGPEWSNATLGRILRTHLAGAKKIGFIDWHTGLGAPGESFFLCFDEPTSPAWHRACDWWGSHHIGGETAFGHRTRPKYQGLLIQGVQRFMPQARLTGAVIEFGTVPYEDVLGSIAADNLVKFNTHLSTTQRHELRQKLAHAFIPEADSWRRSVIDLALMIQHAALRGVAAWAT